MDHPERDIEPTEPTEPGAEPTEPGAAGADRGRDRGLARALVALADTLVTRFDIDDYLNLLCQLANEVLEVEAAGVMLEDESGGLKLTTASTDEAEALDLFERQARQGPCWEAYRDGTQIVVLDLREHPDRWPEFAERALQAGIHAVCAFPMRLREQRIGAMNLFRHEPGRFDDEDVVAAQAMADVATIGILSRRQHASAELLSRQLQYALDSRVVIEQAKGILANLQGISPETAFDQIREHARARNLTVRTMAETIVDTTTPPAPEE